jgi:hypothetical protein
MESHHAGFFTILPPLFTKTGRIGVLGSLPGKQRIAAITAKTGRSACGSYMHLSRKSRISILDITLRTWLKKCWKWQTGPRIVLLSPLTGYDAQKARTFGV